jgi:hypothetical protein
MLRIDIGKVAYFLQSDFGGTPEIKFLKLVTDIHAVVKLFHRGGDPRKTLTVAELMRVRNSLTMLWLFKTFMEGDTKTIVCSICGWWWKFWGCLLPCCEFMKEITQNPGGQDFYLRLNPTSSVCPTGSADFMS